MEPGPDGPAAPGPAAIREGWFHETCSLWPGQALSLQVEQLLHHQRSRYQDILVFRRYSRRPGPAPPSPRGGSQPRPPASGCPYPRSPPRLPPWFRPSPPLFLSDPCLAPFTSGCPRPSLPSSSLRKTVRTSRQLGPALPSVPSPPRIPTPWAGGRRFGRSSSARRELESAPTRRAELHVSVLDTSEPGPRVQPPPSGPASRSPPRVTPRTQPWRPLAGWGRFFSPRASGRTLPPAQGTHVPDCHSLSLAVRAMATCWCWTASSSAPREMNSPTRR